MIKEFKEFIMRGNVLDLAVAVIIAGAFGLIVGSFVKDIIMPPIGILLGGVDFANLQWILKPAVMEGETVVSEAVGIRYGQFINTIINFLIVAAAIFMVVKAANSAKKKEEEAPAAPPAPSDEVVLLREIRDSLKK